MKTQRISSITDKSLIILFQKICDSFGIDSGSVSVLNSTIDWSENDEIDKLKSNNRSIDSVNFLTKNHRFDIKFRRGITKDSNVNSTRDASPYFDELYIVPNNNNQHGRAIPTLDDSLLLTKVISQNTGLLRLPKNVDDKAENSIDLLQAEISNLAAIHREMLLSVEEERAKAADDIIQKKALFEKEKQSQIDLHEELHQKEMERLSQKELHLNERGKELDDRDYMFVRRELSQSINKRITDRLNQSFVSPSAAYSKQLVTLLLIGASAALGYISYEGFSDLLSLSGGLSNTASYNTSVLWAMLIKTFLASIGSLLFLVYVVRWLQQLYYDDKNARRELERYSYDITRSSWIIETVMEMHSQQNNPEVPKVWIEAVCNNLFNDINHDKDASQQSLLAELLNSSAQAQFSNNGFNFNLNKRGTKSLAKKV